MRVLVTGGAGFIGSHLTIALLRAGHSVRVLDNLSSGFLWRLRDVINRIEWIEGDICDARTAASAVAGMDAVLHEAAIPSVARSVEEPVASDQVNVNGSVTILQACRNAGVKRLVYAASSSAYGDSPVLPKVETMCPVPMSPYAVSKLAAEQYCQVFAGLGFVETVCLRYFNVFGAMQDPNSPYSAVIPKFVTTMIEGRPIRCEGDGTQSRDFTHVDNVVAANLQALEAPGVSGEVLNVGCGERYDLNRLIAELGSILNTDPIVDYVAPRQGDVPHSLADISKAQRLLGYEPVVGFREGLEQTVAYFQCHSSNLEVAVR